MKPILTLSLTVTLLGLACGRGYADVVYTTGGSPPGFFGGGLVLSGVSNNAVAEPFTPTGNFLFSSVEAAFTLASGTPQINLSLRADSAGLPGAILENLVVTLSSGPAQIYTENSLLHPLLQSGVQYWIAAQAGGSDTIAQWDENNAGAMGPYATSPDGGATWDSAFASTLLALEVNGDPVGAATIPEPGSLSILAAGLGIAGWWWKRRAATAA